MLNDKILGNESKIAENYMSIVIILAGIPGSGKSTVLKEVIKIIPTLEVINYGEIMLKEAALQNIDKDTLRKLPLHEQQNIGIEASKKISSQLSEIVCIDTHAMIKTDFGYCPGLPEEVLKILKPNVLGMVECSPTLIQERRLRDRSRKRDIDSVEQIDQHQQISRAFLVSCCVLSGSLYVSIDNRNTPKEAADQLAKIILSYKQKVF